MRSLVLLGTLGACGRIGFDSPADAGTNGGFEGFPAVCSTNDDCLGCGSCAADQTCAPFGFTRFSLGQQSALAQAADGSYWGWGANTGDPLDLGLATTNLALPVPLTTLAPYTNAVIGASYGAGFAADGSIWAWGNAAGTGPVTTMTPWHDLQVAWGWGCALRADDSLWCWGTNYRGNLGDGTNTASATPIRVGTFAVSEYQIDQYLGCAVDTGGQLWCWGDNARLAAGDPTPGNAQIPPTRVGTRTDWKHVTVGGGIACAMATAPAPIECWGAAYSNGQNADTAVPTPIDVRTDWMLFRSAFYHSCAISVAGDVWCWGGNGNGELGTGDTNYRIPPTKVSLPGAATELALGESITCARVLSSWWCWGRNDSGQLGIGALGDVLTPLQRCP